jgi:hypothetical protein
VQQKTKSLCRSCVSCCLLTTFALSDRNFADPKFQPSPSQCAANNVCSLGSQSYGYPAIARSNLLPPGLLPPAGFNISYTMFSTAHPKACRKLTSATDSISQPYPNFTTRWGEPLQGPSNINLTFISCIPRGKLFTFLYRCAVVCCVNFWLSDIEANPRVLCLRHDGLLETHQKPTIARVS